jgi:hypothetical protein
MLSNCIRLCSNRHLHKFLLTKCGISDVLREMLLKIQVFWDVTLSLDV